MFLSGFKFGANCSSLLLRPGCAGVVGIDFPERRMLFDLLIKKRLGDGGIVDLAMTVTAVADEIDDDIGAEFVAVLGGNASDPHDGIDVFSVDVEDGNGLTTRDAGGKPGGVFLGVAGGEAEKIIDDDVNGAADGIAGKVGVIHGFGEDALSGESGIAMDQEGKIFIACAFGSAVLLGTSAADGDGIDGLEVAGVGDEMDVNFAATSCCVFAGGAHVIFHVAGAENTAGVDVFESGKDFLSRPPGYMGHDVEAPPVAHSHHEFDRAEARSGVENFIDQRNESGDAFEGETLAA